MIRIDASPNTTQMIDGETIGDRPNPVFVGEAMGTDGSTIDLERTVATIGQRPRSEPTRAAVDAALGLHLDLVEESFDGRSARVDTCRHSIYIIPALGSMVQYVTPAHAGTLEKVRAA